MPNRRDWIHEDDLVTQSPRKGATMQIDDIILPDENEFEEISKRPSHKSFGDIENAKLGRENGNESKDDDLRPESSSSQCSYQEMNMKEASHADEKEELAAEIGDSEASAAAFGAVGDSANDADSERNELFGRSGLHEQDPMSMSYYNNGTDQSPFETPFEHGDVDMNAVQTLPDDVGDDDEVRDEQPQISIDTNGNHGAHFADHPQSVDLLNNQFDTMGLDANEPQYVGGSYDEAGDELTKELAAESEKQHHISDYSESIEQQTSITQVVHELATEVTSVLSEFESHHQTSDSHHYEHTQGGIPEVNDLLGGFDGQPSDDVIHKSELSVSASEFVPAPKLIDAAETEVATAVEQFEPKVEQLIESMSSQLIVEPVQEVSEPAPIDAVAPETTQDDNAYMGIAAAAAAATVVSTVLAAAHVQTSGAKGAKAAPVKSARSPAKPTDTKKPDVKAKTTTTLAARKTTTTSTLSKAAPSKTGGIFLQFH